MKTKFFFVILVVALCLTLTACGNGEGSSSKAATPPKSGEWLATADFGTFIFTIDSSGSAIEKINYSFTSLKCANMVHSGGVGSTFGQPPQITNGEFTLDFNAGDPMSTVKEILTITGKFDSNGEAASGTWEDKLQGTVCSSGTWTAIPN